MEEKYTIILSDGTEIGDLTLNGNNYISEIEIDAGIFAGNCSPLTVKQGDEVIEEYEHGELVQLKKYGDEYWMVFREIDAEEIAKDKVRADVDYIAMMTDIDLEEV